MIMGDNPREGFTREGVFYHPDLAFSFSVPSGWTLINERSQVVLVSDNQQAVTIFSVPGVASPAEAVDEIGNLEQITVNARESVQIGGLPAVVMNGTMMNEGTAYYIEVTGIAHRGNVYRFFVVHAAKRCADLCCFHATVKPEFSGCNRPGYTGYATSQNPNCPGGPNRPFFKFPAV